MKAAAIPGFPTARNSLFAADAPYWMPGQIDATLGAPTTSGTPHA